MELVWAKDASVVFLVETLTDDARLEFIQSSINFYHKWVVPRVGKSGGLVFYWRSSINLSIEGSDKHYIGAIIVKDQESKWHLTSFYGEPEIARRSEA